MIRSDILNKNPEKDEFKILSPTAILGYGFPEKSFLNAMEMKPDLIAVDAGSTDPGPYYLGAGVSFTDRLGVKRDLRYILTHGVKNGIPIVIGSAGGSGAKPHMDWCEKIIKEIAMEEKLTFKLGKIYSDIDKKLLTEKFKNQELIPLGIPNVLNLDDIEKTTYVVAQIGVEPFIELLKEGCDVILAGRAYDPACFASLPIMLGYDRGLAIHLGKILECAAIAASPGSGSDCAFGILKKDSFILVPLNEDRIFTTQSVAAHSLYEKSDPVHLPGPGGELNLEDVQFLDIGNGMVEVKGSKYIKSKKNMVKLEGSKKVGYRTITIAGSHDPVMIEKIDSVIDKVKERVNMLLEKENIKGDIFFHVYGKNGVMGRLEPINKAFSYEIGILIEAIADTQENANTICSLTRSTMLHYGYEERISTAGNLAFPFSPSDIKAGEVYIFSIYHLMEITDFSLFKKEIEIVNYC
ncbi:MAG: DUF1446 domain-containing protein [Spirochaetales bacterium]|nr:DUF1446 domain-containing protein [Spirochaetales bacterium]